MAAPQQQEMKFISRLSVTALLSQQKISDPANCMGGSSCDWVEKAVAMYKKGVTAVLVDFELLKKLQLAEETNGDLGVLFPKMVAHGGIIPFRSWQGP